MAGFTTKPTVSSSVKVAKVISGLYLVTRTHLSSQNCPIDTHQIHNCLLILPFGLISAILDQFLIRSCGVEGLNTKKTLLYWVFHGLKELLLEILVAKHQERCLFRE